LLKEAGQQGTQRIDAGFRKRVPGILFRLTTPHERGLERLLIRSCITEQTSLVVILTLSSLKKPYFS